MALNRLPTEILEEVIWHSIPEGFECLALTCKRIYMLCLPKFKRHNMLRLQFRKFRYRRLKRSDMLFIAGSAFQLISCIAIEPIVARYIVRADFTYDAWPNALLMPREVPAIGDGTPLTALFASSPYLKWSGLNWNDYYTAIGGELKACRGYSQHAATFLLTLLPNIESFSLPTLWESSEAPNKVIDAIVHNARKSELRLESPGLAKVGTFGRTCRDLSLQTNLTMAVPFLALPLVQFFHLRGGIAWGSGNMKMSTRYPIECLGEVLSSARFLRSFIDEVAIADFLKHTPSLRSLQYDHYAGLNPEFQDWKLCGFISAIQREVGSHLVELSISFYDFQGIGTHGHVVLSGFVRLRKLELPLDIVMYNAASTQSGFETLCQDRIDEAMIEQLNSVGTFVENLPASVSQVWLASRGWCPYNDALDHVSRGLSNRKIRTSLREIHLSYDSKGESVYKVEFKKLADVTEGLGVALHLMAGRLNYRMEMEGGRREY